MVGTRQLKEFIELLDWQIEETTCTTPGYGAPGFAHCAACCYGDLIEASSQKEHDYAVKLRELKECLSGVYNDKNF